MNAQSPTVSSPNLDRAITRDDLRRYIQLRLLSLGLSNGQSQNDSDPLSRSFVANVRQKTRLLRDYRCPADQRIEDFLNQHCASLKLAAPLRLPVDTFTLDQPGVARELSLPSGGGTFESELLSSYKVRNGVLHNPRSDRRTTKGTFHVAEGGLPIPDDKIAVSLSVYAQLFARAVAAPADVLVIPYTASSPHPGHAFVSLLLRPIVVPEIPGVGPQKRMEIRFFAPGSLVSNLDFVETIFGNAGDPVLPENDAGLDIDHWTGHTGCVILAPHLTHLTKKELGLPHVDQATDRQKRDAQCWRDPSEKYNDGNAFKITCRSEAGVMVTLIADNYYGYCKKEVKTQISFAANLLGNAEEEHSGGAIAFPSFSLGDEYHPNPKYSTGQSFAGFLREYADRIIAQPEGYAIDKQYPDLLYIPEDATLDVRTFKVNWTHDGQPKSMPISAGKTYMLPSGMRLFLNKHPGSNRFRLIITAARPTSCHKPCTVSGGGKSEISKSLLDYMIYGPVFVNDLEKDLDQVDAIFRLDHTARWQVGKAPRDYSQSPSRPILSRERTLGSVIKLFTPSDDYTDAYNKWLASVPSDILALVFLVKRRYKPEWNQNWREHFTVDIVNGEPGHELRVDDKKAGGTYLRVGLLDDGGWRTFKLRQDFYPAAKVQTQDDITASTVIPADQVQAALAQRHTGSVKLVINTEARLFQRPDDAIHPGLDKQTELDMARSDNFISNFEPLTSADARAIVEKVTEFDAYSPPMKSLLENAAASDEWVVSSAHPRLVDGKPSKNPRYLQLRPDILHPINTHIAEMSVRLAQSIPADKPVVFPVDAILIGRRNNPADTKAGIRGLAVYNPIHYQELPELFMDFICSLTGKSPSTTGAGSEGALTKGPFNALSPTIDLNAALVSYILTGLGGFSTSAGHVGPHYRVDHDISLLVPEIWSRLQPHERDPKYLIENGYLEKIEDFTHNGQLIPAARLGYRITYPFVRSFFGRIFDNPAKIFDDAMLKPELQSKDDFADGILNIAEAQHRAAMQYFNDGSVERACPPLKALLHVMAHGKFEGKEVSNPAIRALFTREKLLQSDWYRARLATKQKRDIALWQRHVDYLEVVCQQHGFADISEKLKLPEKQRHARAELTRVSSTAHLEQLVGTIGADEKVT